MIWVRSTQWLKSTEWPQSGGIQPKDRKFGSSSGNKKILLLLWQVQTLDKKTLWVSERERERERERESESIRSVVFVAQKLFGFERESGWPDLAKIHHFIEFSKSLAKNWEDIRYFVKVYPTLAIYLCPIGLIFNILIAQILNKTFLSLVTLSRGWDWKWENSFKRKLLAPFVLSFLLSFFIPFLSSVIFCPEYFTGRFFL